MRTWEARNAHCHHDFRIMPTFVCCSAPPWRMCADCNCYWIPELLPEEQQNDTTLTEKRCTRPEDPYADCFNWAGSGICLYQWKLVEYKAVNDYIVRSWRHTHD